MSLDSREPHQDEERVVPDTCAACNPSSLRARICRKYDTLIAIAENDSRKAKACGDNASAEKRSAEITKLMVQRAEENRRAAALEAKLAIAQRAMEETGIFEVTGWTDVDGVWFPVAGSAQGNWVGYSTKE